MSREALVLLVCCCDFRDGAEWLIPSKSLRNAVIRAFPGLFCILRMCAPRRAAAVVRPRGREKSADRRRRILISRLLIIRASVPRRKSPFPAYFKGFPAVSLLIPPYPAFLKYPVSPHLLLNKCEDGTIYCKNCSLDTLLVKKAGTEHEYIGRYIADDPCGDDTLLRYRKYHKDTVTGEMAFFKTTLEWKEKPIFYKVNPFIDFTAISDDNEFLTRIQLPF